MNLEGRKNNIYFDQTGTQILVGDLLKVYHYGSGNKTRYMYHVAVMEETKDFPVMAGRCYVNDKPHYRFYVLCDNEQRVFHSAKIIYKHNWEEKRLRIELYKNRDNEK